MTTRSVTTSEQAEKLASWLVCLTPPYTFTVKEGKVRSLDQNALLHKWYGEIARHYGDRTMLNVKATCHVDYGVAIRCRDELFNYIWVNTLAPLGYEKQVSFFEKQYRKVESDGVKSVLYMTSVMTAPELSEYMDAMQRDYRAEGVHLTVPEDAA